METQFVYLHIEKTAGSAQRIFFCNALGNDNVYWHGVPSETRQKESMYDFFFIGGHKTYPFYDNQDLIYTSVIRNPVERILSFYNYCKEVIPEFWVPLGLDVGSLKNTLKTCEPFRNQIRNAQCSYVSGSERYDDAMLFKRPFLIGCFDDINAFNSHIARKLELCYKELPLDNVGRQGYLDDIDLDEECLAEIESVVSEDIKLYKFISEDCKGLYSNISDARWKLARSALRKLQSGFELPLAPDNSVREEAVRSAGLVLFAAWFGGQTTIHRDQTLSFELEFSIARAMETLEIGIHVLDSTDRLVFGTDSTMMAKILTNVDPGTYRAHYYLVADLPEGQYTAGFTFTERHADEYRELARYDGLVTFQVTVSRQTPSVGYASLPCEFDCRQTSDTVIGYVEDATGTLATDAVLGDAVAGEVFDLPVRLENASAQSWVSTLFHPINLSYHWLDQAGSTVVFDGERTPLPVLEVLPGQTLRAQIRVVAPSDPGRYRLMLVPVQEMRCWFDERGFTPGVLEMNVVAQGAARRYPGADVRLPSQVGRREKNAMVSSGREGFLLFGPYTQLPIGQYVARLEGKCESGTAGVWLDVACGKGTRVLARQEVGERAKAGWIAELPFELAEPASDVEVRFWVAAETRVRVEAMCIIPMDTAANEQALVKPEKVAEIQPETSAPRKPVTSGIRNRRVQKKSGKKPKGASKRLPD